MINYLMGCYKTSSLRQYRTLCKGIKTMCTLPLQLLWSINHKKRDRDGWIRWYDGWIRWYDRWYDGYVSNSILPWTGLHGREPHFRGDAPLEHKNFWALFPWRPSWKAFGHQRSWYYTQVIQYKLGTFSLGVRLQTKPNQKEYTYYKRLMVYLKVHTLWGWSIVLLRKLCNKLFLL